MLLLSVQFSSVLDRGDSEEIQRRFRGERERGPKSYTEEDGNGLPREVLATAVTCISLAQRRLHPAGSRTRTSRRSRTSSRTSVRTSARSRGSGGAHEGHRHVRARPPQHEEVLVETTNPVFLRGPYAYIEHHCT